VSRDAGGTDAAVTERDGTGPALGTRSDADPVDRSPTRASAAVALVAAVLAAGFAGAAVEFAGSVGSVGVALIGYGLYTGERKRVDHGTVALVFAVVVAGLNGAGPRVTVPAALCAVVAWDAGGYAITLGRQLGREADTGRAELAHVGLTVGVGAAGVLLAGGAFLAATGGAPTLAVIALFSGALALVVAVSSGDDRDG